jgi:hypothetical protein
MSNFEGSIYAATKIRGSAIYSQDSWWHQETTTQRCWDDATFCDWQTTTVVSEKGSTSTQSSGSNVE